MNSLRIVEKIFFIIIALLISSINPAYQNNEIFLQLEKVFIGDRMLDKKEWDNLKVNKNEALIFYYKSNLQNNSGLFYRIFIDGIIYETKYEENRYSIIKNEEGTHIVKIVPFTADLIEGTPLVFTYTVQDIPLIQNADENSGKDEETKGSILIYILIVVIILQLVLILFLLFRKKENKDEVKFKNDTLQELSEVRLSHKRLLEELKHFKEENEYLKKKIEELNLNVETLEKANVHLVEQKEKLAVSKRNLELLHAQKEELFAMAVHDIKNPASAIRGYIELLNSYDLNAVEQQEIISSLVASSEDIVKLSQDMCSIIAKAMPEPKLKFIECSLKRIIDDVYNQNLSYAKAKKVKLINKSTVDLPLVKVDPEKIEEAIDNLVNNAIKYAPLNTIVEVRSFIKTTDKKYIVVEVEDNGVGLAEEDLKRSFKKGSVLSAKPTGLEQSSGLGLWIVKKIIDEHGGKVSVESKLGVGSTFSFLLPIE